MPIPENKTLENLLNFASLKHKVISQNIANAETLGYKRRDVEFKEILMQNMNSEKNSNIANAEYEVKIDESTEKVSGVNNVDVNKEMADLAQNNIMFKFGAKKLSTYYQTLQHIIKGGG